MWWQTIWATYQEAPTCLCHGLPVEHNPNTQTVIVAFLCPSLSLQKCARCNIHCFSCLPFSKPLFSSFLSFSNIENQAKQWIILPCAKISLWVGLFGSHFYCSLYAPGRLPLILWIVASRLCPSHDFSITPEERVSCLIISGIVVLILLSHRSMFPKPFSLLELKLKADFLLTHWLVS